jgi:hypothetical protein
MMGDEIEERGGEVINGEGDGMNGEISLHWNGLFTGRAAFAREPPNRGGIMDGVDGAASVVTGGVKAGGWMMRGE